MTKKPVKIDIFSDFGGNLKVLAQTFFEHKKLKRFRRPFLKRPQGPGTESLVAARRLRNPPRERRQAFSRVKRSEAQEREQKQSGGLFLPGKPSPGVSPTRRQVSAVGRRKRAWGKPCKGCPQPDGMKCRRAKPEEGSGGGNRQGVPLQVGAASSKSARTARASERGSGRERGGERGRRGKLRTYPLPEFSQSVKQKGTPRKERPLKFQL